MSTFIFNGVESNTIGLMVTKTPVPPCSQQSHETVYIPGGHPVYINKKIRENYNIPIEAAIIDTSKLRTIYNTLQGRGNLILSREPDKYYRAICKPITPNSIALYMHSAVFEFECEPYAYNVNNDPVEITETGTLITVGGNECAEPVIKIYGSGEITLTVNNDAANKLTIYNVDEYVIVDSERMAVHKDGVFLKNSGKLPLFGPDDNLIDFTGNVTKLEVIKNERWK